MHFYQDDVNSYIKIPHKNISFCWIQQSTKKNPKRSKICGNPTVWMVNHNTFNTFTITINEVDGLELELAFYQFLNCFVESLWNKSSVLLYVSVSHYIWIKLTHCLMIIGVWENIED